MINTMSKAQHSFLTELLNDLITLRQNILESAQSRLAKLDQAPDQQQISFSTRNLACYLAFREHDLRPLQDRLSRAGVSSLGRGESNIMANIDQVINILSLALQTPQPSLQPPWHGQHFDAGIRQLQSNADDIFGASHGERLVRIMLTLPSEAAQDIALVEKLLSHHVECVRINCAHDNSDTWLGMINNVKSVAEKRQQPCKILMDLAGKKIRTGQLQAAKSTRLIKTTRHKDNKHKTPEVVILTRQESPLVLTNNNAFPVSDTILTSYRSMTVFILQTVAARNAIFR